MAVIKLLNLYYVLRPRLMSSMAFTSKVGSFTRRSTMSYAWGPKSQEFGSLSQTGTSTDDVGYSYRSPLIKSDGIRATNYTRKVCNFNSMVPPRVTTSSHKYEASSSIGYRGLKLYGSPHGSSYGSASVFIPNWMENKAVQDTIIKLNDLKANLMEDFAQTKQTFSMITSVFGQIVRLFLLAYRGKWRKLRRSLRALGHRPSKKIGNGWLMYYYGIRPMVSTIDALCQSSGPRKKILSGKTKVRQPVDPMGFVSPDYGAVALDGKAEQLVACGMTVAVEMDDTRAYWNSLGFTGMLADDALVTAWAIVPYSFVLDWILPVERFLRTRNWSSGIKYQTGYITRRLSCVGTFEASNPMTGSGDSGVLPRAHLNSLQFQRVAYNTFTPPSGLALNLSLTSTNLINALALINQRR